MLQGQMVSVSLLLNVYVQGVINQILSLAAALTGWDYKTTRDPRRFTKEFHEVSELEETYTIAQRLLS